MARRPKPAAASRMLATGLSTTATFAIVAVLASGAPAATASSASAATDPTRAAAVAPHEPALLVQALHLRQHGRAREVAARDRPVRGHEPGEQATVAVALLERRPHRPRWRRYRTPHA